MCATAKSKGILYQYFSVLCPLSCKISRVEISRIISVPKCQWHFETGCVPIWEGVCFGLC